MWKYLAAWVLMLLVAVANGALRDFTYGKYMDELAAHQFSTLIGAVVLGAVIWGFLKVFPLASEQRAIGVGLLWVSLTVAFEFLFFHYVGGHSWAELLGNYNVMKGRVWVFLLLWLAVAPYIFFRLSHQNAG